MSRSRIPSVDEQGRPIVADLGRAETADEKAERKATASATRRANQTAFNLVVALVASLGIMLLIVLVVVRPQSVERDPIDYRAAATSAEGAAGVPLVAPELPEGWTANRAEYTDPGDGRIRTWEVGLLTPGEQYIGVVQGIDVDTTWLLDQTAEHEATDRFDIAGVVWHEYDRRDVPDPGNLAYILTATFDRSTVVLGGTAGDDEFATLAEAIAQQLGGSS